MRLDELDTPALILDLDGLEDNLERYQRYFNEHRIGLRPHIKTHKCLAVAHRQLRLGAIGIACQKLGEAETMAAGGAGGDVLIPFTSWVALSSNGWSPWPGRPASPWRSTPRPRCRGWPMPGGRRGSSSG
jgi:D-serine deaminase-like pyridoxal phosphate-dependent protein